MPRRSPRPCRRHLRPSLGSSPHSSVALMPSLVILYVPASLVDTKIVNLNNDTLVVTIAVGSTMSTELPSFTSGVGHPPADSGPAGARPGFLRPPIVYLGSILLGVLLDIFWPLPFAPRGLGRPLGGALALASVALFVAAVTELRTAGTPGPR